MHHGKKKLATTFFPVLLGLVAMLIAACGGVGTHRFPHTCPWGLSLPGFCEISYTGNV